MSGLDQLIPNLENTLEEGKYFINKIKYLGTINSLQTRELELLSNISSNIHLIKDQIEELYYLLLDKTNYNHTAADKERIRDFKINNKIQEMFMPYMILSKLILQNKQ